MMALLVMAGAVAFGVALPVLVAWLTFTAVGVASVQWVRQTVAVSTDGSQ